VDELVVRIFRVVACVNRLRILGLLARAGEMPPSRVARELGMSRSIVCTHLRRLASVGLIQRRRSGVWRYCEAASPYGDETLSGSISRVLSETLRSPRRLAGNCRVVQLCNSGSSEPPALVRRAIFDAATGFTNVRRLQILRRVAADGAADVLTLCAELHMSPSAVSRHGAKLVRRGYVTAGRAGPTLVYRLAKRAKTPVHGALFDILRAQWRSEAGRTGTSPKRRRGGTRR